MQHIISEHSNKNLIRIVSWLPELLMASIFLFNHKKMDNHSLSPQTQPNCSRAEKRYTKKKTLLLFLNAHGLQVIYPKQSECTRVTEHHSLILYWHFLTLNWAVFYQYFIFIASVLVMMSCISSHQCIICIGKGRYINKTQSANQPIFLWSPLMLSPHIEQ